MEVACYQHLLGTTSACAENTFTHIDDGIKPRNYLRVRGEYITIEALEYLDVELPPRARRIRRHGHFPP